LDRRVTFDEKTDNMSKLKFDIDSETYAEIAGIIHSAESPVGIDAKKTHILILNKLQELGDRLERIEAHIAKEE
jgi:hypothetical protein